MKKLFIIALVFITTSCTLFSQEEKFVNPLFYKYMESTTSKDYWDVQITPTSYIMKHRKYGYTYKESCEMLKNTYKEVILKCQQIEAPEGVELQSGTSFYKAVLDPYKIEYSSYRAIWIYDYDFGLDRDWSILSKYVINPDEE